MYNVARLFPLLLRATLRVLYFYFTGVMSIFCSQCKNIGVKLNIPQLQLANCDQPACLADVLHYRIRVVTRATMHLESSAGCLQSITGIKWSWSFQRIKRFEELPGRESKQASEPVLEDSHEACLRCMTSTLMKYCLCN